VVIFIRAEVQDTLTGHSSNKITKDPLLDTSLQNLLGKIANMDYELALRIDGTLARCKNFGLGSYVYPTEIEEVSTELMDYCAKVRYAKYIRDRLVHFRTQQSTQLNAAAIKEVPIIQSELDMESFFTKHAEKRSPVHLKYRMDFGLEGEEFLAFFNSCFDDSTSTQIPLAVKKKTCAGFLEKFRVPLYMAHDYIQRTNVSHSERFLPTLLREQQRNDEQEVYSCPHGMNMFIVPISETINVNLIQRSDYLHLSPNYFSDENDEVREVSLSVDSTLTNPSISAGNYIAKGALKTHVAQVQSGHVLYVPGNLVAVKNIAFGLDEIPTNTEILRFCFVDASNINIVKQELSIDALVDKTARRLLYHLQSPNFDSSMFRRPTATETIWTTFTTWPRDVKIVRNDYTEQLSRRERFKVWQEDKRWDRYIQSLTLPVSMPPILINSTRTTVTLKWQDIYKPQKNDITPYGYEIRWFKENVNQPEVLEATPENEDEANLNDENSDRLESQSEEVNLIKNENAMNVTHDKLDRSTLPTTLFGDDFDGKDIEFVVTGLEADTEYFFTVRVYVGESFGLASSFSRTIRTKPSTVPSPVRGITVVDKVEGLCCQLKWIDPEDDGGRKIEVYLISIRDIDDPLKAFESNNAEVEQKIVIVKFSTVKYDPPWKKSIVCNLLPGKSYQFRVAAVNSIGPGPWSGKSDSIEIPLYNPSKAKTLGSNSPLIKGIGDMEYTAVHDFSVILSNNLTSTELSRLSSIVFPTRGPLVQLWDSHEKLIVSASQYNDQSVLNVWSGHYSPKLFGVTAGIFL
jgi:hypothetical protein